MRLTKSIWQTYKENPSDAVIPSHQLMMRAGLIQKSAAGIYNYLPFAYRSIRKIEQIVREEMNNVDAQEILMSVVTPGELWQESGRWDKMGGEMLKFKDKGNRDLCISPTNEEVVTDIFRGSVKSYKQLPQSLYQINTKFRDEIRPRFGLMRGREFTMKDAYSFHMDKECLDKVYNDFYGAYEKTLKRINLEYIIVEADGGAMADGDAKTHEFQVVADSGEDLVIYSDSGYAANIEKAETKRVDIDYSKEEKNLTKVATPNMSTIEDVCSFLKVPQTHSLKSLMYKSINGEEEKIVLVLLLGDDQLNELKLKNYLLSEHIVPLTDGEMFALKIPKGFIGPVGLGKDIEIIYDKHIDQDANYIIGAMEVDQHYTGFVPKRDGDESIVIDLRLARSGDHTIDGNGIVKERRGIEVGHIFQLGDKYTEALGTKVLDQNGKTISPLMGCYGLGITRVLAAAIEQHHDENGIIWPKAIAPYDIYFALIGKSEEIHNTAEEIYKDMKESGFDVVYDDRKQGPGFKFKDSDLLGLPLRVVLGERDFKVTGELEIVVRGTGEKIKVKREDLAVKLKELYKVIK
jgi:prolyl-tRNA synthetase